MALPKPRGRVRVRARGRARLRLRLTVRASSRVQRGPTGHIADTERRHQLRRHDQFDLLEHLRGRCRGVRAPLLRAFRV